MAPDHAGSKEWSFMLDALAYFTIKHCYVNNILSFEKIAKSGKSIGKMESCAI